jgi:hypothetical protein
MWSLIVAILALLLVLISTVLLYFYQNKLKEELNNKLSSLVNKINKSQMYEFNFDKENEQNIKNMDANYKAMYDSIINLQNNMRYVNTKINEKQI